MSKETKMKAYLPMQWSWKVSYDKHSENDVSKCVIYDPNTENFEPKLQLYLY